MKGEMLAATKIAKSCMVAITRYTRETDDWMPQLPANMSAQV